MTAAVRYRPGRLARLARLATNLVIGSLLATQAVFSILALGWLTRHMGWTARSRMGDRAEPPGWLLGPRERGRVARAVGGLAANIRSGAVTMIALMIWTLPMTIFWLGAWWAGWENSFNKGYEQAVVGPSVFVLGTLASAVILPALPFMLAHLSVEDRLSAAFELRRIRGVMGQSGWRLAGLAFLGALLAVAIFGGHGIIVLGHEFFPGLEDMTPDEATALRGKIQLVLAAIGFGGLFVIRTAAARAYAFAAPRAAGLAPGLWDGSVASEAAVAAVARSRLGVGFWLILAIVFAVTTGILVLMGQFVDHAWWRWLFHPVFMLPWPG